MEHKLSKKAKIFLSVASAIITNTAVTTLLTSCSLSNKIDDIGGFDKEYGINNATYTRMEEDFEVLYRSQLDQRKESGEINDDAYDSNLYAFQNKLNSLHTSLYSGKNKTLSYTIKTNVLRDYARDNYGIRLSRQSSVILDEAISDIKSSIVNSVLLMCKEYGITDTSEYYKNVETEFERLEKEAKAKYGDTDVVSIIQYIQSGMTTCFKGICEQLDCLATQQQLKRFLEKYSINVKESVSDDYCWDKLFSKYGEGGNEISVEDFNNIFTMTYEETDPQSSSSSYFPITKKTKEFKNDLITGYTLKPILVKMNGDPYTNTYSIDVDYTLVKTDYIKKENVAQLTAHSSALKNKSFYEDENKSIFDLNASDEEREYTNYVLPITKEYEQQQINATYFNNEDFKFTWSTSEEYGYDDFWTESNESGEYNGKLNASGLATSGMMINNIPLIDILNQAGKISLSGGSDSLSGKAKTKGEDAKQWKLIVDGNEIKNEDISWKLVSATTANLPDSIKINDGIVSWTDQIEAAGTYSFYVLANYKETKIQTPLITLTISSSEQSAENIENFNHAIKNMLYDENTIDQKLLDFVKNVDFSLDYTEKDYDADKDGKKGEILINNIVIGYKNSKNTFKVSNLATNEAISNAINNDSGVTARVSKNLYKNIKSNYLSVSLTLDILKIYVNKIADDTSKDMLNLKIEIYVTLGVLAVENVATTVLLFFYLFRKHGESSKTKKTLFTLITIVGLIVIGISNGLLICNELNINSDKIEKIENLKKQCDTSVEGSDKFFQKIFDDQKYFWSNSEETAEKCQEEFNNLSISKVKEKKWFYEQCKNKPADYEENPDEYKDTPYGMFKNSMKKFDEVNNILVDVSWRFATVIIIDCIVFILICLCVIFAICSYNKNVETADAAAIREDALQLKKVTKNVHKVAVTNGLRSEKIITNNQFVDGDLLDEAITNKNIIIRDQNDFDTLPDFDPKQYGQVIVGKYGLGKFWIRIKLTFYKSLENLVRNM